jgi:hypothetical protein
LAREPDRNARLRECADIMRALLRGETVSHHGRVAVVDAKLYSLPKRRPPLFRRASRLALWRSMIVLEAGVGTLLGTRIAVIGRRSAWSWLRELGGNRPVAMAFGRPMKKDPGAVLRVGIISDTYGLYARRLSSGWRALRISFTAAILASER